MKLSRKWMYWAMAVPVLGAAGLGIWRYSQPSTAHAAAATATMSPIAVSTKPGDPVNRIEHLTCEVTQGWPVILVRDANDQSPWWVQGRAERQEAQRYSARAHFGNETTESGQRYQIVVLSAADESAARQFETGTTLDQIPADLPRSEPIEVVRR
ncbi:MAG: hypothetical protein IAG10_34520 [Planctomycetaceae bacterium]|nr:hypothetical protein [Planctomycetaceae bacterium]